MIQKNKSWKSSLSLSASSPKILEWKWFIKSLYIYYFITTGEGKREEEETRKEDKGRSDRNTRPFSSQENPDDCRTHLQPLIYSPWERKGSMLGAQVCHCSSDRTQNKSRSGELLSSLTNLSGRKDTGLACLPLFCECSLQRKINKSKDQKWKA